MMLKKMLLAGIGSALVAAAALADWPCVPEDTTVYKINAAEKAGTISADEALMYRYMALYERNLDDIPAAYRGEWYSPEPWACGTPVVMELWRRWPYMDPTVKARLRDVCGLGETQGDLFAMRRRCSWGDSSYGGAKVYAYDTPEGNFKVHYVLDGANALVDPSDPNHNGVPDCVEKLGADLERGFAQYVKDKWYYHPDPEDQKYFPLKDRYEDLEWPAEGNDFGGDDRWDAYCGKLSGGVGGIAYADQPFPSTYRDDYSGYMNFRNTYDPAPGGGFGEPVITAHEYMHVSQFMFDVTTPGWYLEASAMWAEDTVYPDAADPRGRMNTYLSNTLRSINNTGDGGYIACVINFFFRDYCWRSWRPPEWREIEGYLTPREIWRALAKGDQWYTDNPSVNRGEFDAFDFIIRYYHVGEEYVEGREFADVFQTWNAWNWFTGPRDDDKHYRWDYGGVGLHNQWGPGEYPVLNFQPSEAYRMNSWGHGFYYFTGLPNWPAAVFKFEGDPDNLEQSKDWGGMIMATKNGASWTNLAGKQGEASRMCSPADKGIIQVRNPGQYDALVMIINNTASLGAGLEFQYSVYGTDDTTPPMVKGAIVRPQANPDYMELLLGSDEDLFGAPEAEVYFTPRKGEGRAAAVEMSGENRSFIGTFVMNVGENGSGTFKWTCADTAGNIIKDQKDFGAGFLSLGGGTVASEGAVLKVPAGAIRKASLFTIVPGDESATPTAVAAALPNADGPAVETVGRSYEFGPNWARLVKPVRVTLSYDGLEVAREEYLSVYRWNGTAWEDLGGTVDKRGRRVTTAANGLGKFVLGYGEKKGSTPPGKPVAFGLYQNYPNPARNGTVITYTLPAASDVALTVYDLSGRRVATVVNGFENAGVFEVEYALADDSGRPLPAGVYVYRLTAGTEAATRKMVVTR
ncbi:MAG TPA: T9SS type A sorting domain-containing protein [bacterium]|nr:T9SS type A sorting domain-containing protein [bacterium]